ncbi:MAG: hypothetical protein RL143_328, partial [Pseudomonadota bacterium]
VAELGKDAALAGARAAASAHLPRVSLALQRTVNDAETDQFNVVDGTRMGLFARADGADHAYIACEHGSAMVTLQVVFF